MNTVKFEFVSVSPDALTEKAQKFSQKRSKSASSKIFQKFFRNQPKLDFKAPKSQEKSQGVFILGENRNILAKIA